MGTSSAAGGTVAADGPSAAGAGSSAALGSSAAAANGSGELLESCGWVPWLAGADALSGSAAPFGAKSPQQVQATIASIQAVEMLHGQLALTPH